MLITVLMAFSLPGINLEDRITRSPSRMRICLWASRAMRARALMGSPWLPVVTMMISWSGRFFRPPAAHLLFRRDAEISQLAGQADVGHHAAAVEEDLAPLLGGDVDNLLQPGNVRGEDRDDHPAPGLSDQIFQGVADLPLRQGIAGTLGIGGIGEQGQDPPVAIVRKTVQVGGLPGGGGGVDFKITRSG